MSKNDQIGHVRSGHGIENIRHQAKRISTILDGNWVNDNMGAIEELQSTVPLLVDALSLTIALLVEHKVISMGEIKELFPNGYQIDYK